MSGATKRIGRSSQSVSRGASSINLSETAFHTERATLTRKKEAYPEETWALKPILTAKEGPQIKMAQMA